MSLSTRINRGTNRFVKSIVALYVLLALILGISVMGHASDDTPKRIVVVETMTLPLVQGGTEWFRKGMGELGYKDGQDIEYVILNAEGDQNKAHTLLSEELTRAKPDIVISIATLASRASRELLKTHNIPQVFFFVSDPVKEGFVSAIGKASGSNITGRTHVVPATAKMAVVKQSLKTLTAEKPIRIGVIHSTYPSASGDAAKLLKAAEKDTELQLIDLSFEYLPGEEGRLKMRSAAMALLDAERTNYDALWLTSGPSESDPDFLKAIKEKKIPIVFANNEVAAKSGVLLAMVSNEQVNGMAATKLADQIFNGHDAGDIPITRPNTYLIILNITTATEMGTVIPSALLELAGNNIYR